MRKCPMMLEATFQMVEELLDFSRIQDNRLMLQKDTIDILAELGETVLTVSFEGEEPTKVEYKKLTDEAVAVVKNGKAIFVTQRIDIDTLIGKINEYFGGE